MPLEIIVVNNCSTDRTREILLQSWVKVIDENTKWISYARNCWLENANWKIIFQTDADTLVPPTWIDEHNNLYNDEKVWWVSWPIKYDWVHYLYYLYRSWAIWYHALLDLLGVCCNAKWWANLSYKKEDVQKVGWF